MNVGFHCWEFPPTIVGGLGTYAQSLTPALAARRHHVFVWTPEHTAWPASVPPVTSDGVQARRVPLFDATPAFPYVITDELRGWGRFFSDILTFNLQAAAETRSMRDLDVVGIQDWLSAPAGLILRAEGAVPVVFHVHSTEWGRQPGGGSPAVHHFEGALGHQADAVITVSEAMKDDLVAHGWDGSKIFAIWNGVDPERYRPDALEAAGAAAVRARYGVAPEAPLILFVGRLTAVKGVEALIEAMPAALAAQPEARLVVLGRGELEGPLEARVHQLGIDDAVRLRYEFVPEAERIAHYAACDLAVFPSTYEPFGIVCLEAMAMGKPVVVGARGVVGFREQVIPSGPEQTGLHVNGQDPADIGWGLAEALREPARLAAWGRAARERALGHFTWAHAAAKTEAAYAQAVQQFAGR